MCLGAPSILVTNFLEKSPTKSPILNHRFFCFKSPKCAILFSCDKHFYPAITTESYSTFWWLETEKLVIWNWWFGWWLHQKIGDKNGRRASFLYFSDWYLIFENFHIFCWKPEFWAKKCYLKACFCQKSDDWIDDTRLWITSSAEPDFWRTTHVYRRHSVYTFTVFE